MISAAFYLALLVALVSIGLVVQIARWHSTRPTACLERHFREGFLEAVERGDYTAANHYAGAWLCFRH